MNGWVVRKAQSTRKPRSHQRALITLNNWRAMSTLTLLNARSYLNSQNTQIAPTSSQLSEHLISLFSQTANDPPLITKIIGDEGRIVCYADILLYAYFRSSSTLPLAARPKVSMSILATLGDRKAGSVGPMCMPLTPKCSRARSTMTAFCSYHAML